MNHSWTALSPAQWELAKQVFEQVLALPEDERMLKIRELALAPELQTQIESLLRHAMADATGAFTQQLRQAARVGEFFPASTVTTSLSGTRLGAWELEEQIGIGGMGEVYKAHRVDGRYEGWAAVKVLRTGRDGDDIVRRFASEQQALARLNHPHIARLLDAGLSSNGAPYFVMELVDGLSIDRACLQLSLRERLALFLQLLQAVSHAHARLLVHRDLKPSNVMVDREQQVKLLDFGIAKAIDPMQGDESQATILEQRVLTPAYSSPEQIRGEPVTTATDIYSLGVLLYGILTGQKPYGRQATTPAEAAHAVLHELPEAPSTIPVKPSDEVGLALDASMLQGDIDNIVLKALRKDPEERYASVDAFAADIRAYLEGYPVSARPLSTWYLLSKWISRHRFAATMSAFAVALILGASSFALLQAHRAQKAQLQAQENLERLKSVTRGVLYRVGNQIDNLPGGIEIRAKMMQDLIDDLEKLASAPDADPAIQEDLAHAWSRMAEMQVDNQNRSLQQNTAGFASAKRAIYWFERCAGSQNRVASFSVAWGEAWRAVANVARGQGKVADALEAQQQRLHILEKADQRFPKDENVLHALASTHLNRAQLLGSDSKSRQQADAELRAAQEKFTELVLINSKESPSYHQLGVSYGAEAYQASDAGEFERSATASAKAVQALQQATHLKPQNVAHWAALANEANLACNTALALRRKVDFSYCEVSWAAYDKLIQMEPDNTTWRTRRAAGAVYTGVALSESGQTAQARQRFQTLIPEFAAIAKSDRELRRLAWLRVEFANLLTAPASHRLIEQSKPLLVATEPAANDQAAWLLRARWFEVAAKFERTTLASQYRHFAEAAYQQAQQIQALPPLYAQRWQQLKN
ncbi:serine/threonine-protein kinase [Undibacterium cyanobacteriorum]|uniref:Serine/threonine-protein kinase n=1 Tax=Undibacterium cyanobacteriorum TaxID=3073561 RepID=A0ABY9RI82_9BURK|nr:serine/threonine-protein kinase [Undibacterium sp. 20NA77.5]WMW80569.1 serine/threonine-protein kinase [Undibacterium sp. 20NA77.5]